MDLRVTDALTIPDHELSWRFDTSGGPGGQHANRSATRVTVEFDVAASPTLTPQQRKRILESESNPVTATVNTSRSQWRNRQLARKRLAETLAAALAPPPPPRRPTKPSRSARQQRLNEKRKRGEIKRQRKPPEWD